MKTACGELEFPVNIIDTQTIVSPEGIIQLALSRYRRSGCTDGELAGYIAEFLGFVMRYNRIIECIPNDGEDERFRYLIFEKKDES